MNSKKGHTIHYKSWASPQRTITLSEVYSKSLALRLKSLKKVSPLLRTLEGCIKEPSKMKAFLRSHILRAITTKHSISL